MTFLTKTLSLLVFFCCSLHAASPFAQEMAMKIDALVEKKLSSQGEKPNPIAEDAQFLRRATLGIIGRVPTVSETNDYLNNPESGKKFRLIDQLLENPGYAAHQTNWMTDIVRAESKIRNPNVGTSGQVFIDWIHDAMAENMPYDKFVYEMLSSSGDLWDKGTAPVGYYMRDYKMPMDNLANSMQIFLGTRMACAQCHDHPFDKWTQKNFFELSAFINGLEYSNSEMSKKVKEAHKMAGTNDRLKKNRDIQRELNFSLTAGLYGPGNGHTRLPHDYKYKDAQPGDVIKAKVPFGPEVSLDFEPIQSKPRKIDKEKLLMKLKKNRGATPAIYKDNNSREVFATWVTSKENPRFSKVIANRLWKRVMGMGLIEPVDDIRETTVSSDPELMALLEEIVLKTNFDLKEVYRTLFYTNTFARSSQNEEVEYSTDMLWKGPIMKRLSAEQIWDSLMSIRSDKADETESTPITGRYPLYDKLASLDSKAISSEIKKMKSYQNKKGRIDVAKYTMAGDSSMSNSQRDKNDIFDDLGPMPSDRMKAKEWKEKRRAIQRESSAMMATERLESDPKYLRASEMTMPAKPGHFLYQLGQSTKDSIEGANDEANIPQVLTLMNGLEPYIYGNQYTGIRKYLAEKTKPEDKINVLFKGTLTRNANEDEMKNLLSVVKESPETAYQDILWILVNTHEFKFVQ